MYIKKWRPYLIVLLFLLLFGGLIVRLLHVQLIEPRAFGLREVDLVTNAVQQQSQSFLVDSGRGTIYDRNGVALTGERDYHVIVFPLIQQEQPLYESELGEIAEILGWTEEQLLQQLQDVEQPQILQSPHTQHPVTVTEAEAERIQNLQVPGIHALYSEADRFATNRLAHHLLGTVAPNPEHDSRDAEANAPDIVGIRGLEKSFDPFLHDLAVNHLSYAVDGQGKSLNGKKTEWVNSSTADHSDTKSVETTVDADVQRIVEQAMDREAGGIDDGAAVLLDIATGDVLAMASRPTQGEAGDELPSWANRALLPVEPGSIFKTVIAVAALDQGLVSPDAPFHCDGKLDEYNLPCWTFDEGGHGHLTFAEAYAESCNVVFGMLATQLGGDTIESYAHKLGLGTTVGWRGDVYHNDAFVQLPEEDAGQLFHDDASKRDGYALAQTGIGQRDVRVTPLQAAYMVVSLFHPEKRLYPRVVQTINYANGDPYFSFPVKEERHDDPIKPETLQTVRELMQDVVTDGTATHHLADAAWPLGGKTGTAQIGETGNAHRWMIGYAPAENPQYAIAVVSRNEAGDNGTHMHVFRAIVDGLAVLQTNEEIDNKSG